MMNKNIKKKDKTVIYNEKIRNSRWFFHKIFKSTIKNGKKIKTFDNFCFLIRKLKMNKIKPLSFFDIIFKKLDLNLDYKTQNLGSIKYKLPYVSRGNKSASKAVIWVKKSVESRQERSFNIRLLNELTDIVSNKGLTIDKKKDFYNNFFKGRPFLRFLRLYKPVTKYRFNYRNILMLRRRRRKFKPTKNFNKKVKYGRKIKIFK